MLHDNLTTSLLLLELHLQKFLLAASGFSKNLRCDGVHGHT